MPSSWLAIRVAMLALLLATVLRPAHAQQGNGTVDAATASPAASDSEPPPEEQQAVEQQQETGTEGATESVEVAQRLLDRDPFDRITLNAENQNAVIETVLLDLPERRVPDPLPNEGKLALRRLSEPSIPYELDWPAIQKIELYEQLLLTEAQRLTAANEFAEAFEYFAFLTTNYPQLPALEAALQSHLWREASTLYAAGSRDEAWPVLHALYLRNPQFPRLAAAVQAVSNDMIEAKLKENNYAAARSTLTTLAETFSKLQLENIATWTAKFEADAQAELEEARAAFAAEHFSEARAAITRALAILPTVVGGKELWQEIQGSAPEIRVGVSQLADRANSSTTLTWAAARVGEMLNPRLVEMVGFGAEGGAYASRYGQLSMSDDGLESTIRLSPDTLAKGLWPDRVALELAHMGMEGAAGGHGDFAALLESVGIADGQDVVVRWRRIHIRPESLLQPPLPAIVTADQAPGLWFAPVSGETAPSERSFVRTGLPQSGDGRARFVVEMQFDSDEAALAALTRGDVDVLDRVPPWQLSRLESSADVVLAPYRLPTIHALIPHPDSELLQTREFRRAICYGIDAESIVRDILLGGESRQGFRTISGPFLAGASLSDPVGYAYNPNLQPRPYEPRLAAILSGVARQMIAKRKAEAAKKEVAKKETNERAEETERDNPFDNSDSGNNEAADANDADPEPTENQPLVLAHSTDPVARLACQTIKAQLDAIGIPVKLAEFSGDAPADDVKYDLLYTELAVWEPIAEARRLLGPQGLASGGGPLMTMALDELARAENWNQARAQLHEIHRIAHYDLPLVPLWQTANYFAYRKSLDGIGDTPMTLYQNLDSWRKEFE